MTPRRLMIPLAGASLLAAVLIGAGVSVRVVSQARVPLGFRIADGARAEPYTGTGWGREIVHEKTGIFMVFIPAGEFQMGSPVGEKGHELDEEPLHVVHITKPFYLGKYEVTRAQWDAGMGGTPMRLGDKDRTPASSVSWDDCQAFLQKVGEGLRLPTEAEWEYACRAGTTTAYSFGNNEMALRQHGWYDGNSSETHHEVGRKTPNRWGLYDMHGNLWEWCSDWYGPYPPDNGRPMMDPAGPATGGTRVHRGGAWCKSAEDCRCAERGSIPPSLRLARNGFRVAMNPK
jgi:formylglycine-generating enzyme required for sulfatase activity